MTLEFRKIGKSTLVADIDGRLSADVTERICTCVNEMALAGCEPQELILKFDNVEFLDSADLGHVVSIMKQMKDLGIRAEVSGIEPHLQIVREMGDGSIAERMHYILALLMFASITSMLSFKVPAHSQSIAWIVFLFVGIAVLLLAWPKR